jgi:hypothetical protein
MFGCQTAYQQDSPETVKRVACGPKPIALHCLGKSLAELMPIEDFPLLAALENRLDVEEAERILARPKAEHKNAPLWEKARKKLGLQAQTLPGGKEPKKKSQKRRLSKTPDSREMLDLRESLFYRPASALNRAL